MVSAVSAALAAPPAAPAPFAAQPSLLEVGPPVVSSPLVTLPRSPGVGSIAPLATGLALDAASLAALLVAIAIALSATGLTRRRT